MPNRSVLQSSVQAHIELAGLHDAVEFQNSLSAFKYPHDAGPTANGQTAEPTNPAGAVLHPPDDQSRE